MNSPGLSLRRVIREETEVVLIAFQLLFSWSNWRH